MSWLRRLFGSAYAKTTAAELAGSNEDRGRTRRVEVRGRVELLDGITSPVDGAVGVLIDYDARARSAAGRLHFGTAMSSMDLRYGATQAVDFVVRDETGSVLIRVDRGRDVTELHGELTGLYGVELDAQTRVMEQGASVCVRGELVGTGSDDPHRSPWQSVVMAHDISPA